MTETELAQILLERFKEAGLRPFLVERQQQCLELENCFFAEIVLNDASKIGAAKSVVDTLKAELKHRGIDLDVIVRSLWIVKEVRYLGAPPAESGGIKTAGRFLGVLESGGVEQVVEVDVSNAAEDELKKQVGRVSEESLKRLVENFLRLQLSQGGTSYWDPIRYRHQDLGPAAVMYLLHHSPMSAA